MAFAEATLQSSRALATNSPCLDDLAVSCGDNERDHSGQGEVDVINSLAGPKADRALRQRSPR